MKAAIQTRCCNVNCRFTPPAWVIDWPPPASVQSVCDDEIVCATGTCEKCGAKQMWPLLHEIAP